MIQVILTKISRFGRVSVISVNNMQTLTNALFFAPRWETFGGVNYKINDHFDIGLTAVNFLNQTGAKGAISGAELITDASAYYDQLLVGSYIRPFTLEASLNFRF